jgi:phage-related protein
LWPLDADSPHDSLPPSRQILELRAKVGSNISRVLYYFVVGKQIALTHGFIKKTQKTPKREIERAKACRQDYFEKND